MRDTRYAIVLILIAAAASSLQAQEIRLRPTAAMYLDASGSGMNAPRGVDYDGESVLAIADTGNHRILVYRVEGDKVAFVNEMRVNEARHPVRVRLAADGGVLVLDGRSHRIARVSKEGVFLSWVAVPESDRMDPVVRSFDIDSEGNLYVLEAGSGRALVLAPDDSPRREIAYGPEVRSLADLALGSDGRVFAVDSVARRVFVAQEGDASFQPLTDPMADDMTFPTGIAADGEGYLYLADDHGSGIVVLGQDGSFQGRESAMGWKEGFLRYPSGVSAGKNLLFVADRGNNRVQIFTIVR